MMGVWRNIIGPCPLDGRETPLLNIDVRPSYSMNNSELSDILMHFDE